MTEQTTHFAGDLDTDVSLEAWDLTLPEGEAGCEEPTGCPHAAEWRAIKACGHHRLLCAPCRQAHIDWLVTGIGYECATCGVEHDGHLRWHRI